MQSESFRRKYISEISKIKTCIDEIIKAVIVDQSKPNQLTYECFKRVHALGSLQKDGHRLKDG